MELSLPAHKPFGRQLSFLAWALLVLAAFAMSLYASGRLGLTPGRNEYNLADWETRNFLNKWLYEAGSIFRSARSARQEDADLRAFLQAVADVGRVEREEGEAAQSDLRDAVRRRDRLENRAEATIEGRITVVAKRDGLTRDLGPLGHVLWPPVDMEFTAPPRTLAISPRDRIELQQTTLLRAGLDLPEIERIEREREASGKFSALAVPTSGVGAYPTIVTYTADYRTAVEVAAHEWTHNYLAFRPLGVRYYTSNDLRTMNETVADLVGKEIADAVLRQWPLAEPPATGNGGSRPASIDVRAELVSLRGEVDQLLAQGRIEEAEALMETRRQYLAANGVYIRRLNQAYFAFNNLYAGAAGSPAAVNPIGPKIDELRRRSSSLADFLRIAGSLTSVQDLDRALASLPPP